MVGALGSINPCPRTTSAGAVLLPCAGRGCCRRAERSPVAVATVPTPGAVGPAGTCAVPVASADVQFCADGEVLAKDARRAQKDERGWELDDNEHLWHIYIYIIYMISMTWLFDVEDLQLA